MEGFKQFCFLFALKTTPNVHLWKYSMYVYVRICMYVHTHTHTVDP